MQKPKVGLREAAERSLDDQLEKVEAHSAPAVAIQPAILLVDDDPHMLGLLARTLKSLGYSKVISVASAKAALSQLHNDPQAGEVIVCDLNMPGWTALNSCNA